MYALKCILFYYLIWQTVHINNISQNMPALARNANFIYFFILFSYIFVGFL